MKTLSEVLTNESILDDQEQLMNNMTKDAVVLAYNDWLKRNSLTRGRKITSKNVQFIDGEWIVEHPFYSIDIRELPPFRVVISDVSYPSISASVGTNRNTAKAGVTLLQQMQTLRKIIEDSGGYELNEFKLDNKVNGEKKLDSEVLTALGPIEIRKATLNTGEAAVHLPYIWRCKELNINCEGHGDVYMTGLPAGNNTLKITRS